MTESKPLRVAAFDCGTNSIRLLVLERDSAGQVRELHRDMTIVRLGQGVDETGQFAAEAIERTLQATVAYERVCQDLGVSRRRFVATSATRDASNRDVFINGVDAILGVHPEVISGGEEARLSFTGALGSFTDLHGTKLIIDLGGGSTELVLGDSEPRHAHSMDIGCVRMYERHVRPLLAGSGAGGQLTDLSAGGLDAALAAIAADTAAGLDLVEAAVPQLAETAHVIGLAGTITSVTAMALGLDKYDSARIHGTVLSVDQVLEAALRLWQMPVAERAALGFMHPGRVDVIGAGAVVWAEILRRLVERAGISQVHTSEHDILDGICLDLLELS